MQSELGNSGVLLQVQAEGWPAAWVASGVRAIPQALTSNYSNVRRGQALTPEATQAAGHPSTHSLSLTIYQPISADESVILPAMV